MDLFIADLLALDSDLVDRVEQELAQKIQEAFPAVDLARGALHDLVLHLMAIVEAAMEDRVDRVRRSMSLLAIEQDPSLADDGVVDAVLSNFRITRQPGAAAAGQMTIVLDAAIPTTIPAGAVYVAGAVAFVAPAAYAARLSVASVVSATDRVLRPLGNGTYAFTIPMVAQVAGSAGALRRGARMVPAAPPAHFALAYAEGDFSGGLDPESNADLLGRLQEGVAAPAWSNRTTIDAMIRAQPAFARILNTSIVGFGDAEMVRDRHTVLPISLGGRCDLYARTALLPLSTTLQVACTLVAKSAAGGTWQFSLGRDDAPGFYAIDRVAPPDAAPADSGYAITADERGFDNAPVAGWAPDVETAEEAAYSALQTGTFRFLDPDTPTAGLTINASTATYAVAVSHMPQVADLQAFLGGRGVRGPAGDVLVRAPVPCFLSAGLVVRKRAAVAAPDAGAIAAAVAAAVNTAGFAGQLAASAVAVAVQPLLPAGAALGAIDLFGRIRRPDNVVTYVRSADVLLVPTLPEAMTTGRTVAFFLDPADVTLTVVDVELEDV